jgi:hypothetical protein
MNGDKETNIEKIKQAGIIYIFTVSFFSILDLKFLLKSAFI